MVLQAILIVSAGLRVLMINSQSEKLSSAECFQLKMLDLLANYTYKND